MVLNPPYGQMQRSVNVELDEFSSELRLLNNQSDTHCPLERCNQSRMWRPTHTHDRCMHRCLNAAGWFTSSLQMLDFPITVIQMWCGFLTFFFPVGHHGAQTTGTVRRKLGRLVKHHALGSAATAVNGCAITTLMVGDGMCVFHMTSWPMDAPWAPSEAATSAISTALQFGR